MNFIFKNEIIDYEFFNSKKSQSILFLHGWGGNKNSFASTVDLLKSRYNVVTITMPTTTDTTVAWELNDYARLIEEILNICDIKKVSIICHSFGFRVASLLNGKIKIQHLIITGGAGLKNTSILNRIKKQNNLILLKQTKYKYLYKQIASRDYISLSEVNKITFKNIVNFNTKNLIKFNCPILLFWGKNDTETPLWMAKKIKKFNSSTLIITPSNHFAYLTENALFNNKIMEFLC